jgi:hypothetical protein
VLYLVFAYEQYYPSGGMGDCEGVYTEPRAAWAKAQELMERIPDNLEIVMVRRDGSWEDVWSSDNRPEYNAAFLSLVGQDNAQ